MAIKLKKIPEILINLVFPRRCPVCDEIVVPFGELVCPTCHAGIRYVSEPTCIKCGKEMNQEEEEYCHDCANKVHQYERGMALYGYKGMSDSIYRFKYRGRQEYAQFYGMELAEHLGDRIRGLHADALIPVPIHFTKKRKRGYNQAQLIAAQLSKQLQIPMYSGLISRCRKTAPQKDLSGKERQNNLKKAFKMNRNDVKLDTIVIIDDIYTTGSTIDAMADVLKSAGVTHVYYVALAIGDGI